MQQFLIAFGINWKLLLIQGINFAVLLAVLTYFLYKPLLKIIDERRNAIAEGVRKAHEADRVLADARVEGEELVGGAAREAEQLVATARNRADEKGNDIVKSAEARAASVLKDAADRADEARRTAMLESEKDIARAAMLAAEKVLRQKSA